MTTLLLAWRSLCNRPVTSSLTVLSIAISVALMLGVDAMRSSARESFSGTISGVDLVVGARGGSLQLLLYTVFRIGTPSNNISWETYQRFRDHKAVAWTIPYSLGDSHRGFRVVGTSNEFYTRYRYRKGRELRFREGSAPADLFAVAIGADVARTLGYRVGQKIVLSHGIGNAAGIYDHGDKPFTVSGILDSTATPIDRSLYVSLAGITAIHVDWQQGAPPMPGDEVSAEDARKRELPVEQITSFLLKARSRIDTLRLQREINTYNDEPLSAIIPGVALQELWGTVRYVEDALLVVSLFVILAGLLGMVIALHATLNERRREMAILRSVGAGPGLVFALFLLEALLLSLAGCVLGVLLVQGLMPWLQGLIEREFGLYVEYGGLTTMAWRYLAGILGAAVLAGLLPAFRAYRNALSDGLTIRL
jgi:putative ABC transport system permease protein